MSVKHEFRNTSASSYDWLAFDIETSGLLAQDEVTTLTLYHNGLFHVFFQTGDWETDEIGYFEMVSDLDAEVAEAFGEDEDGDLLVHYPCDTEKELLETVLDFVEPDASVNVNHHARKLNGEDRLHEGGFDPEHTIVTAYNGETWNDGFDLAFLRTRCAMHDLPMLFKGYAYADLYEAYGRKGRFNTCVTDIKSLKKKPKQSFCRFLGIDDDGYVEELDARIDDYDPSEQEVLDWCDQYNEGEVPKRDAKSLDEIHKILVEGADYESVDPLEDSRECLACFRDGCFDDLLLHCIEDVRKSVHLTELMLDYVSKEEFEPKRL